MLAALLTRFRILNGARQSTANRPEVDLQEGLFFGSKSVEAGNTIRFRKDGEGRAPRFWTSVVLDFSELNYSKWFFKKTVTNTLAVGAQLQIPSKSLKAPSGAPIRRFLAKLGCCHRPVCGERYIYIGHLFYH